jgi:hypothetical protein
MTDIVNDYNHMENASQFVDNHCADTCVTCKSDEINDILNGRITDDEIEIAITNLQCGKATGPDGILPEMIKNSKHLLVQYLSVLFNNIMASGTFPLEWA